MVLRDEVRLDGGAWHIMTGSWINYVNIGDHTLEFSGGTITAWTATNGAIIDAGHEADNPVTIHIVGFGNVTYTYIIPPTPTTTPYGIDVLLAVPIHYCEDMTTFTIYNVGGSGNQCGAPSKCQMNCSTTSTGSVYAYKDYDVDFFMDFIHTINLDGNGGSGSPENVIPWMLSNDLGDYQTLQASSKSAIAIEFRQDTAFEQSVHLKELYNGTEYDVSASTWEWGSSTYYFKITKVGTSLTLQIYDDDERTNLITTLTLTLHENYSFRYAYVVSNDTSGWVGGVLNAFITKFDIAWQGSSCICRT